MTELCDSINFSNEILVFVLIFGEPFDAIEEAFGDREQVDELKEAVEWAVEISNDGCPSDQRGVINLYLIG